MHFCPIFFEHYVKNNLTIDFIFAKNVLLRCAFLFKKRQMSFGKNRNLSNDLIYYYSSQPLPKNVLYKPRLFYSNQSIHRNIELWTTSKTWTPAGLSSPGPSSPPIRNSTIVEFHHNLKAEDPQEARRHH